LNDISVYKARLRMGEALVKKIKKAKLNIDVIMPVPDTSRTAALALAEKLGITYREGLIKNRYIGRTFIMPGQKIRKRSIRYKLNTINIEIKDKNILLVDDSIVRGNTSRQIIRLVRDAGAKKVYFVSHSPPIQYPCLYGIDIPTKEELIAHANSVDEICEFIGADKLIYEDIEDTFKSCSARTKKVSDFCMACFEGKYKTGDIDEAVLKRNAELRLEDKEMGGCDRIEDEGDIGESDRQLNLV
jgi:amidophosphoribosyltransferase